MRIVARAGSIVEARYLPRGGLPGTAWPHPAAIAPGISPAPLEDLVFHGGKTVAQMGFKTIYLGSQNDWVASDIDLIDASILRAMQERRLNNVMAQYFPGSTLSCDALPSMILGSQRPAAPLDQPDIEAQIVALFKNGRIGASDLNSTIFNLILPPGAVLKLGQDDSLDGLGGYHGSVHTTDANQNQVTLYYSASVFSQNVNGQQNGIVAFDTPWKNVVATLYHELNEFRTDADVGDAIRQENNDLLGWMSRSGRECGDQPIIASQGDLERIFQEIVASDGGRRIPVQFLYSNVVHGAEGPIDTPDTQHASVTVAGTGADVAPASDAPAGNRTLLPFAPAVDRVIRAHLSELNKPGVLSVRPGYQATGGWITKKPAIVVTVERKQDDLAPADRLPETLGGLPVDVREANPLQRMRVTDPDLYTAVSQQARPELRIPELPLERDLSGRPLVSADVAAARAPAKAHLTYTPPAGQPLDAITDEFTITCHVSPDAGWLQLGPFLAGTRNRLTVGMYDFTSAHILQGLQGAMDGRQTLNMVLDHPAADRTSDQSDDDTHDALASSLEDRLQFAWALEGKDPHVTAELFPSAYHIKVAVRDGQAFWLSSGNWNNSNQPQIDPFTDPQGANAALKQSDRDWHVIVEHPGLSRLFEAYLQNDLTVAEKHQAPVAAAVAANLEALASLAQPVTVAVSRIPKQFFEPKTITANMTIQPALTPDNYPALILDLINSADTTLYMQMPYITPTSKTDSVTLAALIVAIANKVKQGKDVRLILSGFAQLPDLELLQGKGIDASIIKIQQNLHNKGIIVDSKVVAIGSQNWSGAGVTVNRDATLIIHNAEAAQYWQQVFLHDWANMASQSALG
jgi:hypothetical protein